MINFAKLTIILTLSFFGIIGLVLPVFEDSKEHKLGDLSMRDKVKYRFMSREASKIGKKYQMHLCGVGGGAVEEGIWLMSSHFQRDGELLTEQAARELIINFLNDYLSAVNSDEELRPYLKVYPFGPKNIDLAIYNYDLKGDDIYHPYIGTVSAVKGKISYLTDDENNKFKYKSEKDETYEEAVAILGNSKIGL